MLGVKLPPVKKIYFLILGSPLKFRRACPTQDKIVVRSTHKIYPYSLKAYLALFDIFVSQSDIKILIATKYLERLLKFGQSSNTS
jgi:hypothetical protein